MAQESGQHSFSAATLMSTVSIGKKWMCAFLPSYHSNLPLNSSPLKKSWNLLLSFVTVYINVVVCTERMVFTERMVDMTLKTTFFGVHLS